MQAPAHARAHAQAIAPSPCLPCRASLTVCPALFIALSLCNSSNATGFWDDLDCSVCLTGYSGPDCDLPCPVNSTGDICSGAGDCSLGRCRCFADRCGSACEITSGCQPPCQTGYWGPNCGQACPGLGVFGVCNGHGTCDSGRQGSGACSCAHGYFGSACNQQCALAGTLHCNNPLGGECNATSGQCVCYAGYAGAGCGVACAGGAATPCNGRGVCSEGVTGDGTCACDTTAWGADCSPCPGVAELRGVCYGHGTCDRSTGVCTCVDTAADGHWGGASGTDCSRCLGDWFGQTCTSHCPITDVNEVCSGHGSCRPQQDACQCQQTATTGYWTGTVCERCDVGYWGAGCTRQCPGGACSPCAQHGTCSDGLAGTGQCMCHSSAALGYWRGNDCTACQAGYWGLGCTTACPAGGTANPCAGHGTCRDGTLGDGLCVCFTGWSGATCIDCAAGYFGAACTGTCPGLGAPAGVCSAHGSCYDGLTGNGTCECGAGYYGVDCAMQCPLGTVGEVCNGRGTCDDGAFGGGNCTCPDDNTAGHWTGDACSVCQPYYSGAQCLGACPGYNAALPLDQQTAVCSGRGTCSAGRSQSGDCACQSGYAGSGCELMCPGHAAGRICNLRGTCDALTGQCTCHNSTTTGFWAGTNCSVCHASYSGQDCTILCPSTSTGVCSGHGNCLQGRCFCASPYCGTACAISDPTTCTQYVCANYWGSTCSNACPGLTGSVACSGHGQCDDGRLGTGICACDATWAIVDCSVQCPGVVTGSGGGLQSCSGKGTCDLMAGTCTCTTGSAGAGCSLVCPTDPLYGVCSSHGSCNDGASGDATCACTYGYVGTACAEECPGGAARPCSGHGTCIATSSLCICMQDGVNGSWTGTTCDACAAGYWGANCLQTCQNGLSVNQLCICLAGWVGSSCNVACPGGSHNLCHGHGTCMESAPGVPTCVCEAGWLEAFACARTCNGGASTPCTLHGTCDNTTGTCTCYDDDVLGHFTGDACDACAPEFFPSQLCTLQCPKDALGRNCSGHGLCLDGEALCRCERSAATGYWTGLLCESCATYYWGSGCQQECPGGVCAPCSGHGACGWGLYGNGTCNCQQSAFDGFWDGVDCSACVVGYWGPLCASECPGGVGDVCHGHGTCADGTGGTGGCTCHASATLGYWDAATGCADCQAGYWGPGCVWPCPTATGATAVCSGRGTCDGGQNGTGVCSCTAPYYDSDCGLLCPSGSWNYTTGSCQLGDLSNCRNGVVVGTTCNCDTGWRGRLCDVQCPGLNATAQECAGHGQCSTAGTCGCDVGYAGYDPGTRLVACNTICPGIVPAGASLSVCSGHGDCAGDATCTCAANAQQGYWAGSACERCAPEWLGVFCLLQCPKDTLGQNCSSHGQCIGESPECTCDLTAATGYWDGTICDSCSAGYWGANCSAMCPGSGCVCSGRGTCFNGAAGNGTCRCEYNQTLGFYIREDCSECQQGFWGVNCRRTCPGLSVAEFLLYDTHDPYRPGVVQPNPALDPLICYGHGTCRSGISGTGACDCFQNAVDGFWAGVCDQCLAGYWGAGCTRVCLPVDRPGNPCNGGGVCDGGRNGTGTCTCDGAHAGLACELECPSFESRLCNDLGSCSSGTFGTGRCTCPSDAARGYWRGSACEACVAGYWGPNCTAECPGGAAIPCSGHGNCSDSTGGTGECTCDYGYAGARCNIACPGAPDNICSGHGTCDNRTGACRCNSPDPVTGPVYQGVWGDGSAGDDCGACNPLYSTLATCADGSCVCAALCPINPAYPGVVCSGHGECSGGACVRCSSVPERREYWCGTQCEQQGTHCSLTLCPQEGLWGPTCTGVCPGASLNTTDGKYYGICFGHGACDDGQVGTGTCTCDLGYMGVACATVCPGGTLGPCSGHGACTSVGCSCSFGWAGAACDVVCNGGLVYPCTGRGTCLSGSGGETPGSCACDSGWAGFACETACPGGVATPCSGHGTCGMAGAAVVCTCDARAATGFWSGTACSVCAAPYHSDTCSLVCTNGNVVGRLCNCSFGYWGFGCGGICPAFNPQTRSVCSGHGMCNWGPVPATGACTCDADYYGADCSVFCNVPLCQVWLLLHPRPSAASEHNIFEGGAHPGPTEKIARLAINIFV